MNKPITAPAPDAVVAKDAAELLHTSRHTMLSDLHVAERVSDLAGSLAVNVTIALAVLVLTFFVANWASKVTHHAFKKFGSSNVDQTVQIFASQAVRWVVLGVGFVGVLERLGVRTTSIITVIGAASLAIGLALQGTLGNVAAGLMLLLLRAYRVGDYIGLGAVQGTVQKLDLFITELATTDQVRLIVPNSKALGDVITNYTAHPTRRIEIDIEVSYDADLEKVLDLLRDTANEVELVLADPEPWAGVWTFNVHGVLIKLYVFARTPDWLKARAELHLKIRQNLKAAGIEPPYPRQVSMTYAPVTDDAATG